MSSTTTKETLDSLDRAEFLGASTRVQMPAVTPKLAELYGTLAGEVPEIPDFDVVQASNAALLEKSTREVREASHAFRVIRAKLSALRRRRSDGADDLRQRYRNLRKLFEGAYGKLKLGLMGLDALSARRFTAVREQCLEVVERMRNADLAARLGDPLPGQSHLPLAELAAALEEAVRGFEKLTSDLTKMVKVKDEALHVQRQAQKRHRRILANVARVQEGLYRLAGFDELADRIRITLPRRSAKDGTLQTEGSQTEAEVGQS